MISIREPIVALATVYGIAAGCTATVLFTDATTIKGQERHFSQTVAALEQVAGDLRGKLQAATLELERLKTSKMPQITSCAEKPEPPAKVVYRTKTVQACNKTPGVCSLFGCYDD